MNYKIINNDCLIALDELEEASIDSIVTDPPYELNFMGKGWDNSGIAFKKDTWQKCLRILKPGGYLLAFGGSRTFHRIAVAIEDAGFEIRDTIMWLYGSGFPKSMDISKQIDKRGGESTSWFGEYLKNTLKEKKMTYSDLAKHFLSKTGGITGCVHNWVEGKNMPTIEQFNKICEILDLPFKKMEETEREVIGKSNYSIPSKIYDIANGSGERLEQNITVPSTDLAKQWQGWGTALKPSFEPIIVARKPFKGSLVDNVIENGVGGINIDECRVGNEEMKAQVSGKTSRAFQSEATTTAGGKGIDHIGRFPANTILTYDETDYEEVCDGFPQNQKPAGNKIGKNINKNFDYNASSYKLSNNKCPKIAGDNGGSASRYFMNCKYTGKDEEIWKQLLVNNVENNLEILKVTKDNIVQMNVEDLLKELKDHYAKYVENQLDLIETPIVQDIAKMLTWDFKIGTSQVIQGFIINSKKCIQFLNLVQFVEKMDNIDTTQITQNLLKLFGYVKVVITNYILGNIEYDQKRYIYAPKASKKDRDEGLDEFEEKLWGVSGGSQTAIAKGEEYHKDSIGLNQTKLRKNTHPTVKPTELMQYLVRLVTPKGGTILDPFMGSGSTGKAVMFENKERNAEYKFIGIEKEKEYSEIAEARIKFASEYKEEKEDVNQISFIDFIKGE